MLTDWPKEKGQRRASKKVKVCEMSFFINIDKRHHKKYLVS